MSLYDRDYGRYEGESGKRFLFVIPSWTSTVVRLIIITTFVSFVAGIFYNKSDSIRWFIERYLACRGLTDGFWPWQLITCLFLHDPYGLGHLIWNMFGLYIFGAELERRIGSTKFLWLYFGGGICGALAYSIGVAIFPTGMFAIGASGCVMAVAVLFAFYFPYTLFFFFIPAWVIVLLYVLVDLYSVLALDPHPTGALAHVTGAAFGAVFYYAGPKWQYWNEKRRRAKQANDTRRRQNLQVSLDKILEKINREGMTALTKQEKAILKEASEDLRRKDKN